MKLGIDIVEIERVKKNLSDNFISQILSKQEIDIYKKKTGIKSLEFLCGRFAVKEAIIKALSDYENPYMAEIIVLNNNFGKPYVIYKNYDFLISISHEKKYAVAVAILLEKR